MSAVNTLRNIVYGMRVPQWSKNFFVLAPLVFGGKLGETEALWRSVAAFICFCLVSSALYLFNDIVDREADRRHPRKRNRPIASGQLAVIPALAAAMALLALSSGLASFLGASFLAHAVCYAALSVTYTLWLKRLLVLDAISIGAGFALRVTGGAAAVGVQPSHWLIMCAFLLTLYLAFDKRRLEMLLLSEASGTHRPTLYGYSIEYLESVKLLLLCSTFVSYVLYTVAPETVERFGTDRLVYGSVFVLYGLLRYMAVTEKSSLESDPLVLALHDVPLLLAVAGWTLYNALVIYREQFSL